MEAPTRPRLTVLLLVAVPLGLLFGLGAELPRTLGFDGFFGVEAWRTFGIGPMLAAFAALLALLLVPGLADRLGAIVGRLVSFVPARLRLPLLLVVFAGMFLALPTYRLSGDAGATVFRTALGDVYSSNPLTSWIQIGVYRFAEVLPTTAIRLVSVLAGVLFVLAAVLLGRECFPKGPARHGLTALLATCGPVALFFGSIEVYAPLIAALAFYLLFGIRFLRGRCSVIWPAAILGVAFGLHGSAGLLLPSLVLLANDGCLRPVRPGRILKAGLAFLAPVAITYACLYLFTWGGEPPANGPRLVGSFLGGMNLGPLLPLTLTPENVLHRYAVLDPEHLAGVLNLLLLAAPAGILLLLLGGFRRKNPVFKFVGLAAFFLVVFPVFWNVNYELRQDWDLFSPMGVPLTLLGGLAFLRKRGHRGACVGVAALSLFCMLPFVLANRGTAEDRREALNRFGTAAERVRLVTRDSLPGARAAAEHYQEELRRSDPDEIHRRLEQAIREAAEGRLRSAEGMLRNLADEAPGNAAVMEALGFVLMETTRRKEAEELFRQAATKEPWRLTSWLQLGHLAIERGKIDAAIVLYEAGVRRGSTQQILGRALYELARLRDHRGDREIAAALDRLAAERGGRGR
jgi:Tfp pilus assembly protein PilF